jgi:hypothetical protein
MQILINCCYTSFAGSFKPFCVFKNIIFQDRRMHQPGGQSAQNERPGDGRLPRIISVKTKM